MSDYAMQAEGEMWDAIAEQAKRIHEPRPTFETLDAHRQVATDLAAGRRRTAPRECYRELRARFAGKCDYCGGRIRRGDPILYSSLMPTGHKIICGTCDEGRL